MANRLANWAFWLGVTAFAFDDLVAPIVFSLFEYSDVLSHAYRAFGIAFGVGAVLAGILSLVWRVDPRERKLAILGIVFAALGLYRPL